MTHFLKQTLLLLCALLLLAAASVADVGSKICMEDYFPCDGVNKPTILYTGRVNTSATKKLMLHSAPDSESDSKGAFADNTLIEIYGYDQYWLYCWDDTVGAYYVGRHNVDEITTAGSNTVPYGVITHTYVGYAAKEKTNLYSAMDTSSDVIESYPEGTRLSMWFIRDGWAVIPYKRVIGYMFVGDLKDLTPVAPNVDYAQDGDIIAAFTTFYSVKQTELNIGRMENIRVGCQYINTTYEPGFEFDFNKIAGPYRKARGYMPSPVLVDGGTVAGYGGGTCQVSTTLYNALLQLSDGITIVYRRPHGPGGASYAPHGVDAAVGNDTLNFRFRNDYDFPVTIDTSVMDGALCICIRKGSTVSN